MTPSSKHFLPLATKLYAIETEANGPQWLCSGTSSRPYEYEIIINVK